MINSKLVYFVLVFLYFVCSSVSSYSNTSLTTTTTTTHNKYKCSVQQSRALLLFKHSLLSINNSYYEHDFMCMDWLGAAGYYPIMMNWKTNTDCCDWNGVTCDHSTADVIGLDLSCGMLQGTLHHNTSLFNLPHLKRLNLAFNDFSNSKIPREIGRFSKSLTHLNLSGCMFSGDVPPGITLLHYLVSLDLSQNPISLEPDGFIHMLQNFTFLKKLSLSDIYNLSSPLPSYRNISCLSLELLNLRSTGLQGKLPGYIFNLPSLEILDLSGNNVSIDEIPSGISLLPKLVSLDLSDNLRIQRHVFIRLVNNSTLLRELRLSSVNLMGSLPKSPLNLTHLTYLDLSYNKLNGTLPSWLFTFPTLEYLLLDNNMFNGGVRPFNASALPSFKALSLSQMQLGGQIDQTLILQLTNLRYLDISSNNFTSHWELDALLSSLTNLEILDLSFSGLSITTNNATTHHANPNMRFLGLRSCKLNESPVVSLRYLRNLEVLELSSNDIHGQFPTSICNMSNLRKLYLSENSFRGVIPQCLGNITDLDRLYMYSNKLEGLLPPSICNLGRLSSLDLSNNSLGGVIPQCFGNLSNLAIMNLGNNDFHGTIPNTIGYPGTLQWLILKGNNLQGELPNSLSNCHDLGVLDLESNYLNGTFPDWLGGLSNLQVLNLRSNMFYGPIVTSYVVEVSFQSLLVLDLSHNRFVGQLPTKYFQSFNAMKHVIRGSTMPEYLNIAVDMTVKGQDLLFEYLLVNYMIIDLSSNKFEGDIPNVIGNLISLKVLNLSHNNLKGEIPYALGNLSEIESLDLSCNRLTGEIPKSIAGITNLEYLNLSENNLVGRIPEGKQFSTFEMSSFQGNPKLCGFPLPNCSEHPHEPQLEEDEEEDNGFTWKVVMMGYGCGTFVGLLMGYFMLSTGRPKWFNDIADAGIYLIRTRQTKRRYIFIGR
ncbi:receptor-like protein 9DC3 [Rutidosis leptorrhynchoides]|uniref:receptor-like protein 9DC3 n=1 Tax=Rutidosis leptorrhynchoides TaxID=125765 RepID=UPI003A98EF26